MDKSILTSVYGAPAPRIRFSSSYSPPWYCTGVERNGPGVSVRIFVEMKEMNN